MKKILSIFVLIALFALASCTNPDADIFKKGEGVMTYAEFMAAELDSKVTVETFVQAKQGWWEKEVGAAKVGVATFYTQDKDGGYFLYDMPCSKADYDSLVPGTKIRVEGTKASWSGEVEIINATWTKMDGTYVAKAIDVTNLFGTDKLVDNMNMYVSVKGAEVVGAAKYKWNGSGVQGDDLYFDVMIDDTTYTFTVESYLCGKDTEVYKTVEALKVGDVIDLVGFLYWYEGAQPHVTGVTENATFKKGDGVMTYAEFAAAELDSQVVIETFVQDKQGWWEKEVGAEKVGVATFYTQDKVGGYFLYEMPCSKAEYDSLVPGTKIRVEGTKASWSGEVEIINAKWTKLEGTYVAKAIDVTNLFGTEDLAKKGNMLVEIKGAVVVGAAKYKWNGSGVKGDDLYFDVKIGEATYSFTVESYLRGQDTEVYKQVEALEVGATVDLVGFLYWYEGPQPHITAVTVK